MAVQEPRARALVVIEGPDGNYHAIWYSSAAVMHQVRDAHSTYYSSETTVEGPGRHAVSTTMEGAMAVAAGWMREESTDPQRGLPRGERRWRSTRRTCKRSTM